MSGAILLASASAARQALLARAGVKAGLREHGIDERAIERDLDGRSPRRVAATLAQAKARVVSEREPAAFVIGADQTLDLEGRSLAKPENRDAARHHLLALTGRTHALHSSFAIARSGRVLSRAVRTARLTMRPLSAEQIDDYLDRAGEGVMRSVGAYQVEGLGIRLFEKIEGDYFTVLGLPLLQLLKSLRRSGAINL